MMLENAADPEGSLLAALISVVTLFLGASGVFGQLQDAMNTVWEVQPRPGRGIMGTIKDRFLSFTMVLGVGFLLLVSLLVSTALSALGTFIEGLAPETLLLSQIVNFVISFGVTMFLFAMIFKVIPDVEIRWRDVWLGAVVTAAFFAIGRWAIGLYLGQSAMASTYGAAGSIIVLLVWVYYAAQILFLGAEFTQVYANKYGSRIVADEGAVPVTDEARAQQGIPRKDQAREQQDRMPQREISRSVDGGMREQERLRSPIRQVRAAPPPPFVLKFHDLLVNVLAAPVAVWSVVRDRAERAPVTPDGDRYRQGRKIKGLNR
jgi:membrane protein